MAADAAGVPPQVYCPRRKIDEPFWPSPLQRQLFNVLPIHQLPARRASGLDQLGFARHRDLFIHLPHLQRDVLICQLAHRQRQLVVLGEMWTTNTGDTIIKRYEMTARAAVARLLAAHGQIPQALDQSREASAIVDWLTRTEPDDTEWMQHGANTNFERASVELASNNIAEARGAARSACDAADRLIARDRSVSDWRSTMQFSCLEAKARIAMRAGDSGEAVRLAQRGLGIARSETNPVDRAMSVALAEKLLGDALAKAGQAGAAQGAYQRALASWPKNVEERPRTLADHAILLRRLGRKAEATALDERLNAMGYRQPDYLASRRG